MSEDLICVRDILLVITMSVATVFDLKERRIPNVTVILVLSYGLLCTLYILIAEKGVTDTGKNFFSEQFWGLIAAFFICITSKYISKDGLGAGDIKMLSALGFTLGLTVFLQMMIFTALSALVFTLIMFAIHKLDKTSVLPFAPYMTLGVGMACLLELIT